MAKFYVELTITLDAKDKKEAIDKAETILFNAEQNQRNTIYKFQHEGIDSVYSHEI
jgi:hypothetical protein